MKKKTISMDKEVYDQSETLTRNKKGKREYLNDMETKDFMAQFNDYFESMVEFPRTSRRKADN